MSQPPRSPSDSPQSQADNDEHAEAGAEAASGPAATQDPAGTGQTPPKDAAETENTGLPSKPQRSATAPSPAQSRTATSSAHSRPTSGSGRPVRKPMERNAPTEGSATPELWLTRNQMIGAAVALVALVGLIWVFAGGQDSREQLDQPNARDTASNASLCQKLGCSVEQGEQISPILASFLRDTAADRGLVDQNRSSLAKKFSLQDSLKAEQLADGGDATEHALRRIDERASQTLAALHPILGKSQRKAMAKLIKVHGLAGALTARSDRRSKKAGKPKKRKKRRKGERRKRRKRKQAADGKRPHRAHPDRATRVGVPPKADPTNEPPEVERPDPAIEQPDDEQPDPGEG